MRTLPRTIAAGLFHLATLAAATQAAYAGDDAVFALSAALSADQLDEMRGGFVTDQGLTISLGIERLFYVNNELVSQIALHVPQLGKALAVLQTGFDAQQPQSASAPSAPTSVGGAPAGTAAAAQSNGQLVSSAPAPTPASQAHTTPVAPTPGAAPVNAVSSAPPTAVASSAPAAASITSQPQVTVRSPTPSTTVIQSGVQNFVDDRLLAQGIGPGLATVIQNNVDKQILTTMTVVNLRISGVASTNLAQRLSGLNLGLRLSGR